jgi:UPF0755 protein
VVLKIMQPNGLGAPAGRRRPPEGFDLKGVQWIAAFTLAALTMMVIAGIDLARYPDRPDAARPETQVVNVYPGESFRSVAARLEAAGLIRSPLRFRLYARLARLDKKVKTGEYEFSGMMTPGQILAALKEGKVRLHHLTIPEGFNLNQIAQAVAEAGYGEAASFLRLATDPALAREVDPEAQTLEGYLFPDTYSLPKGLSQREIIAAMLQRFRSEIAPQWRQRAAELGLSMHQVLTLASIIEKETGDPAERPLISSVFHNRLRKGMRLETDPTVIYGIDEFDGNLTRAHLRTPTPYNTYTFKGLPPGPIASPGRAAIEAALYPEDTDYLFFVSRKDRTHQFSTNLDDHQKAVRQYQLKPRRKRP